MKNSPDKGSNFFVNLIPDDIAEDLIKVEERISSKLLTNPSLIDKIGRHIMGSGGKRLRPILHLLSARFSDYRGSHTVNVASAVELIHTATLLHDDVVDSALTRRGKPSANVLWGNKSSVLIGDYLFSQCVSMIVEINNQKVFTAFSKAFEDLSTGEILELLNEHNLNISLDSYFDIIKRKTSSLFKLCMECGSYLNGDKNNLNGLLGKFGIDFGNAFQLIDDYLDYFGDAEKMGKPVMGDFREKKVTFPLINLMKKASDKEKENIKELFYGLKLGESEEAIIRGLMEKYDIGRMTLEAARQCNDGACSKIQEIKDSPYRRTLLAILEYNVSRDR